MPCRGGLKERKSPLRGVNEFRFISSIDSSRSWNYVSPINSSVILKLFSFNYSPRDRRDGGEDRMGSLGSERESIGISSPISESTIDWHATTRSDDKTKGRGARQMERDGGREEAEQQFENLSIIQSSGRKISHKDESKVGKQGINKVAGSHRTGSRDWKAPKKGKQRLVRGRHYHWEAEAQTKEGEAESLSIAMKELSLAINGDSV